MANKIFGQDFSDITNPTGTETISVNQSGALKDVTLANVLAAVAHNASQKSVPADADEIAIVDSEAGNILKKTTTLNLKTLVGVEGGWLADSAWTYSSVDGPTGVVSISGDKTGRYTNGMRVRYQQSQALTAYWNLDANSNSQVGSFNGTDTSVTYTAGKFSNAATFNGTTSKIVFSDSASLKPTTEFTVGAWVKTSASGANQRIFQSFSANTNTAGFHITVDANGKFFVVVGKNTGGTVNVDYTQYISTTSVNDGNWHYVVFTLRNNYGQIYVDGVLEGAAYCFTPAYAATNYVRIGTGNSTGSDAVFFNGQIDDVFLINGYALDEGTIRAKYIAASAQGTGSITVTKYGIVTKVGAYSGGNTLLTFFGGTDFTLVSGAISNPYFSSSKIPFGFDANPLKWTVQVVESISRTQANPTVDVWYNLSSLSIVIPIGLWDISWVADLYFQVNNPTSVGSAYGTLSTANNSESNPSLTARVVQQILAAPTQWFICVLDAYVANTLSLASKTTYYFNIKTAHLNSTAIGYDGSATQTKIKATCAYL